MGSPVLLFQRNITASKYLSATNQAGLRPWTPVPGTTNVGGIQMDVAGNPATAPNIKAEIVAAGDIKTSTFKLSTDGGSTWKGRRAYTALGAGLGLTSYMGSNAKISRLALIDSNDDGIDDRLLVMLQDDTGANELYYTDDLTLGTTHFAHYPHTGTNSAFVQADIALVNRYNILFSIDGWSSYGSGTEMLVVARSTDKGVTFSGVDSLYLGESATSLHGIDMIVLNNGTLIAAVAYLVGASYKIKIFTSVDGVDWSSGHLISTETDYINPTLIQESDGKIICFFLDSGTGIKALQTTEELPDATGDWVTYSETLWSLDNTDSKPSAVVAPDGTILVYFERGAGIPYVSKFKDGDANYTAATILTGYSDHIDDSLKVTCFGGAVCVSYREGTTDEYFQITEDWGTYHATNYPASWTGNDPQFVGDACWISFSGHSGKIGDYSTIGSAYDYGSSRLAEFNPSRPCRSTADEANWNMVIDMGANTQLAVDAVAIIANLEHCHFQMNATDTWGAPSVNETISFVEVAARSFDSVVGGLLTDADAGMVPKAHIGKTLYFVTSGNVYRIDDNTSTAIYCNGDDISAETGNYCILNPRKYITLTSASYRFIRLSIESQKTVENYYEIKLFYPGKKFTLAATHLCNKGALRQSQPVEIIRLPSGRTIRNKLGEQIIQHNLILTRISTAEYEELKASIAWMDQSLVPFVLVPDSSVSNDLRLVHAPQDIDYRTLRMGITLEEVI